MKIDLNHSGGSKLKYESLTSAKRAGLTKNPTEIAENAVLVGFFVGFYFHFRYYSYMRKTYHSTKNDGLSRKMQKNNNYFSDLVVRKRGSDVLYIRIKHNTRKERKSSEKDIKK